MKPILIEISSAHDYDRYVGKVTTCLHSPLAKHRSLPLFDAADAMSSAVAEQPSSEELVLQRILRELSSPQPKRPLQCVTYKMPLPHYLAMKRASQQWNLSYSDLLRLAMLYLTPVLEQPNDELRLQLEAHREAVLQKRMRRLLRRKPSLRD